MGGIERATGLTRGGALDALRFAAAAFITLYHFGQDEAPRPLGDFVPAFERGYLATDFFLLLSGYILARTYGPRLLSGRTETGAFMVRRVARLWPAHAVVLGAYLLVVGGAALAGVGLNHPEAFSLERFVPQLFLVHAWGLGAQLGWNSATWTLSALLICYAVFPSLWLGLSRLKPTTALIVGVGVLLAADLLARGLGLELYTLDPALGVARALPLFVLGAAAARFSQGNALPEVRALLTGATAATVLVACESSGGPGLISMLALAGLVLAAGAHAPGRGSRLVSQAAAVSFALFLTHNLVGLVWFKAPSLLPWSLAEPLLWVWWTMGLAATVAAAFAFHRWVDTPLQAWLKPRLPTPSASRPAPAAAPA